ncbi:MAG: serine/threonine protein kinase [Clostridia bacterium]|nr:serine/threonine protein kinase [Clostridia bacterium]
MPNKSLKLCFTSDSIQKEVSKWTENDCKNYITKHEKDSSQESVTKLLNKKLRIVKKFLAIHNNKNNITTIKNIAQDIKTEYLVNLAPEHVRDSTYPEIKFHSYQTNTGVYLWKKGYDIDKCLGCGASAVAWTLKNGNTVARVVCDRRYGPFRIETSKFEISDAGKMDILKRISAEKAFTKYMSSAMAVTPESDEGKAVFTATLASKGPLDKYVLTNDINLCTLVRLCKHGLKGLHGLHAGGYSHNDIKPDNLFVDSKPTSRNITKSKDILNLADFGAMTQIAKTHNIFTNIKFSPPDAWKILSKEAMGKKDIYSLGLVFLGLFIGDKQFKKDLKKISRELITDIDSFYSKYLAKIYKSENPDKVTKFAQIISKMVEPDHKKRCTIDDALKETQELSNILKNKYKSN